MAVTLIGTGAGALPPVADEALVKADLVIGAPAQLAAHVPPGVRTVELGEWDAALKAIRRCEGASESAVVLVAGDPGYFGTLRRLRENGLRPRVLPAVSGIQRIAAGLGRPWDDLVVVSADGRAMDRVLNVCRARPAVAVLTAPGAGPAELAAGLTGWRRTLVVAEGTGTADEEVSTVDIEEAGRREWRSPNVVLCLADPDLLPVSGWHAGGEPLPPAEGWALPEDEFAHRDGMLMSAEVRAVVLARLAPRPGNLVWEVGAGAGAVAVECVRLGAAAIAIERDPVQCVRIVANAGSHGVDVRVVEDEAPGALAGLPRPDSVFVAAGGPEVVETCTWAGARRIVVALDALDRFGATRETLRSAGYQVAGCQLSASRLIELDGGGARLAATDPVMLLWGVAERETEGRDTA
ncbi:precorrin-6y C5,15-methyltransferase (decarboxylating) subunit CbiE [Longimycelium tulufanense]|uniref:precorrin-6y C5,15-methyltransferase (decarboxylating) subunit CbiE n=1 Tax=Longimycelium tulufanense TaxID=907463 RepID=UPI00166F1B1E|nr:precorrin-6y C5,15-methyltransferase (decarboxylating) subunit CbiE [Longimycelium tulufanense]